MGGADIYGGQLMIYGVLAVKGEMVNRKPKKSGYFA
jgi:hypothetical protein